MFCAHAGLLEALHLFRDLRLTFEPSRLQVRLRDFALEHRRLEFDDLPVAQRSQELGRRFCTTDVRMRFYVFFILVTFFNVFTTFF